MKFGPQFFPKTFDMSTLKENMCRSFFQSVKKEQSALFVIPKVYRLLHTLLVY